jgi:hypothetical protein
MAHHMRQPDWRGAPAMIRLCSGGCPYVCDEDGEVIRLAVLVEGHPDDDLPFGDDLSPKEEAQLAP